MLKCYDVQYNGECVGKLQIHQEGLYYNFFGKFDLKSNKIWRIIASASHRKIDLGICLYETPYFILNKRLPIKLFKDENWTFEAVCPTDKVRSYIEIDGAFDSLQDVEKGKLLKNANESVIIFDSDH